MKNLIKIIDITVFALLFVAAFSFYKADPGIFDLVSFAAMIYVAIRNLDINTVTLVAVILIVRSITGLAFYLIGEGNLNPYLFYSSLAVANVLMIGVVIVRPVLISRHGPKFIRGNKRLTMTHQDAMFAWLYFAHAVLPVVTLAEHIIRHLDDVDLKPMFFYNLYKPAQLVLAILGILVLYFMTFEKSKEARDARKREQVKA